MTLIKPAIELLKNKRPEPFIGMPVYNTHHDGWGKIVEITSERDYIKVSYNSFKFRYYIDSFVNYRYEHLKLPGEFFDNGNTLELPECYQIKPFSGEKNIWFQNTSEEEDGYEWKLVSADWDWVCELWFYDIAFFASSSFKVKDELRINRKCPLCGSDGEDLVFRFYCSNNGCRNYKKG